MATKTKKINRPGDTRQGKSKVELPADIGETPASNFLPDSASPAVPRSGNRRKLVFLTVLTALIVVGYVAVVKGLVVSALVNGKPIFSLNLYQNLMSRFGKQTLEGMISEELIRQTAQAAGVSVSQKEIDAKEEEIVKGLGGGAKLEDLLKFQGMTKSDFDHQVWLQMVAQKLVEKDITLTDKQVDEYIASNSSTLNGTDPAKLRETARKALLDEKVSQRIQTWFSGLKDKAKIVRFVN